MYWPNQPSTQKQSTIVVITLLVFIITDHRLFHREVFKTNNKPASIVAFFSW